MWLSEGVEANLLFGQLDVEDVLWQDDVHQVGLSHVVTEDVEVTPRQKKTISKLDLKLNNLQREATRAVGA